MSRAMKWWGLAAIILVIAAVVVVCVMWRRGYWYSTSSSGSYGMEEGYGGMPSDASYKARGMALEIAPSAPPSPAMPGSERSKDESNLKAGERLIIRNASVSLVVKDVRESLKALADYAVKSGGFVVSSNVYKNGLIPVGTIVFRLPAERFDQGLVETKALGELENETTTGTDVTEEFVDLNARLKNLQATEAQFLNILKLATKIPDILAVQNELTRVRAEIESLEGRIKYLRQSADLASISVSLSTDPQALPIVESERDTWKPAAIVKNAARNLIEVAKALGTTIIWIVIFAPVWAVVWFIVWLVRRAIRRHHSS